MSRLLGSLGAVVGLGAVVYTWAPHEQNGSPAEELIMRTSSRPETYKDNALDPGSWRSLKVVQKEPLTRDVFRLRAAVGEQRKNGTRKDIIRPYTPENLGDQKGSLELIVKRLPEGRMSKHIVELEPGDSLQFCGPFPELDYKPNMVEEIGMLAGGSGLTAMLQVMKEIARNPEDKTKVSFIYANRSVNDIILKEELDQLMAHHDNINIHYLVDRHPPKESWTGGVGLITPELISEHLPAPTSSCLILVCGPPAMMRALSGQKRDPFDQGQLTGMLKNLGFSANQVYKYG